jgi:hypothetical protein
MFGTLEADRQVPPGATQRGGVVVLSGNPPVRVHVGGSLDEPRRVALIRYSIDARPSVHPRLPIENNKRQNIYGGSIGWVIRARADDGSADRIGRVLKRIPADSKFWLSPMVPAKSPFGPADPLRTPVALGSIHVPWVKDSCIIPFMRGGAALGLEFVVKDVQENFNLPPIRELVDLDMRSLVDGDDCKLLQERGLSYERAANILGMTRTVALSIGPDLLYNAYLRNIAVNEMAHAAYHRILFEKFLRRKRLVPRANDSYLDKELNRRALALQARRLFVFNEQNYPLALNHSLLHEYGLRVVRLDGLRQDPKWARWLFLEVLGWTDAQYRKLQTMLSRRQMIRRQDDEDTERVGPSEQQSVYEEPQTDYDEMSGLLAGYLTIG